MSLLVARDLHKSYPATDAGGAKVPVLAGVGLELAPGDCVALLGASGSGKSTLLHCLGLLDRLESGTLEFEGRDLTRLSESERARFRLEKLGFVFQFHHLIPELSALENVLLPAALAGRSDEKWGRELLERVGLGGKEARFPWQLSGGEQQRVAVARALVNRPAILMTDEATGNLDRPRAMEVLDVFFQVHRELGTTLLSVTHDEELAVRYARRYRLKDGRLTDETAAPAPSLGR